MNARHFKSSAVLLAIVVGGAVVLGIWKYSIQSAIAAAAAQPEQMESVMAAEAKTLEHAPSTTAIGTVIALRSITLRNELAGTVRQTALEPGRIVEPGTVLVALDVSVEKADLASEAGASTSRRHEPRPRSKDGRAARHLRDGVGPGRCPARRRPRANGADQGAHRAQNDSRAIPCPRRYFGRSSGPVSE